VRSIATSLFFILLFAGTCSSQSTFGGTITAIVDSQTVSVATNGGSTITLRLRSIETPDDGQPLADTVRQHLAELALGKEAQLRIEALGDDFVLGVVIVNGVDLSEQMLRDGAAWYSEETTPTIDVETSYRANEQAAAKEGRGIWSVHDLKRPSELRNIIEGVNDPLRDPKIAYLAATQLTFATEGIFGPEPSVAAEGNCGGTVTRVINAGFRDRGTRPPLWPSSREIGLVRIS
jgi:endonuclease YncB( thermonuclease family)